MSAPSTELAFTFGGGAARAAYQVGFLRHVARRYPELVVSILTGVSAGAINAAYLANHTGTLREKVDGLTRVWCGLSVERVFRVDPAALLRHLFNWGWQLTLPTPRAGRRVRGMVDTAPLRRLLTDDLRAEDDGRLTGIGHNLTHGRLRAVGVTTTSYTTGQTITFCQGRSIMGWERPMRRSINTALRVEHVMASAALPLLFPAVRIGDDWHGDGGIRLHTPLGPPTHLGAGRIVALSTSHLPSREEADIPIARGYPSPSQVLGVLYDAVFLDLLDQDALRLERINQLLRTIPAAAPTTLRRIELLIMRPSEDLSLIAAQLEPRLPRLFRFLTRRLGTRDARTQSLLSMLMFQGDYAERLIALGEADADARAAEIAAILERG